MFPTKKITLAFVAVAVAIVLFAAAAPLRTAAAAGESHASPAPSPSPMLAPDSSRVAAATPEAIRLLRRMDLDKDGKVSRAEFMTFMAAEFDRMDIDHAGELDVNRLEKSDLAVAHHGGTRR